MAAVLHEPAKLAMALNLQWAHLLDTALQQTIETLHLHYDGPDTRAGREAFLTAIGITPAMCIPLPPNAAQANAQDQPLPKPIITLRQQDTSETVPQFLDRATALIDLCACPEAQKIILLQNSSNPTVSTMIQDLITTGVNTYQAITQSLRKQFEVPKSVLARNFQNMRPAVNESFSEFGRRLLATYMEFLGLPMNQYAANEHVIKHGLVLQLFQVAPSNVTTTLRTTFDTTPTMTWTDILKRLDILVAGSQASTLYAPRSTRYGHADFAQQCRLHPHARHSNVECRLQHSSSETRQHLPPGPPQHYGSRQTSHRPSARNTVNSTQTLPGNGLESSTCSCTSTAQPPPAWQDALQSASPGLSDTA